MTTTTTTTTKTTSTMFRNGKSCLLLLLLNLTILLVFVPATHSKEYTRCEVAKTLAKNGFPRTFIPNWVCLVEASSSRSTSKITEYSNYKTFGLFQISSKEWCKVGRKGGECNIQCEDLLRDDITNNIPCVKMIFQKKGFDGWKGWTNKCKGKPQALPDVSKCFDD